MQQMVDSLQSSMRLLVASVRSPDDIVALASQARPQVIRVMSRSVRDMCQQRCCCDVLGSGGMGRPLYAMRANA